LGGAAWVPRPALCRRAGAGGTKQLASLKAMNKMQMTTCIGVRGRVKKKRKKRSKS